MGRGAWLILIRHEAVRKVFVVLGFAVAEGHAGAVHAQQVPDDAGATSATRATRAEMRCEHVDAPGRVRCEVEARVGPGDSIRFGDVVIVRTPPFLTALRGRIGPHDATTRESGVWRWALALAAHSKGSGSVDARVRLIVCRGAVCEPRETQAAGQVVVGD
jgi:hypothetical protein